MMNKLILLSTLGSLPFAMQAADYTNFIIINLDDVGYGDFSFNGAYGYTTPNIDQMAAEGVRFTHFLAGQPISGASRAGL
ncbi:sulfatase-like hydrolase/transferase, partial [uncultured Parabacteroides sp.]